MIRKASGTQPPLLDADGGRLTDGIRLPAHVKPGRLWVRWHPGTWHLRRRGSDALCGALLPVYMPLAEWQPVERDDDPAHCRTCLRIARAADERDGGE